MDTCKPLMVGFTWALIGEITTGQSFTEQFSANSGSFFAAIQLWAFASLAPAFSSNEGYTADPFTMKDSRTWNEAGGLSRTSTRPC